MTRQHNLFIVSVNDCKERWKNIRNRYCKYRKSLLNSSNSGAKTVREYYLAPHLHFLDKYLKSRRPKSRQPADNVSDTDIDIEESNMSPFRSPSNEIICVPGLIHSPLSTPSSPKTKVTLTDVSLTDVNQSFDYFPTKRLKVSNANEVIDEDLSFLHSLLSDMKAMNLSQKRKFKIGVMQLAESILEGSASARTSEQDAATFLSKYEVNE